MPTPMDRIDISGMTVDERTVLGHQILHDVHKETREAPLTPAQLAEIDRRLDDEEAGRSQFTSWEKIRTKLLRQLKA